MTGYCGKVRSLRDTGGIDAAVAVMMHSEDRRFMPCSPAHALLLKAKAMLGTRGKSFADGQRAFIALYRSAPNDVQGEFHQMWADHMKEKA